MTMTLPEEMKRAFEGRRVLVTGHTGFKGAWLTVWLHMLGARVTGLSLPPDQGDENLFDRARVGDLCESHFCDIRHFEPLAEIFRDSQPEIVFHLAAQPLVRRSYSEPLYTFETNVMGTANVLEAVRTTHSVRRAVCVTTDKVYANREWVWGYRETDPLGGADPYSASKSAAEMVAGSYMTALRRRDPPLTLSTARGGNVVGGGDWSEDRLVPDIVRAIMSGDPIVLRNPSATRPWQHVLDLCLGYMLLACRADETGTGTSAFNFGPDHDGERSVQDLVGNLLQTWGIPDHPVVLQPSPLHEARYLKLDASQAKAALGWRPVLDFHRTIENTAEWYRAYLEHRDDACALIRRQIDDYQERIKDGGL